VCVVDRPLEAVAMVGVGFKLCRRRDTDVNVTVL